MFLLNVAVDPDARREMARNRIYDVNIIAPIRPFTSLRNGTIKIYDWNPNGCMQFLSPIALYYYLHVGRPRFACDDNKTYNMKGRTSCTSVTLPFEHFSGE